MQRQLTLPTRLQGGQLGALGQWAGLFPDDESAFPLLHVTARGALSVLFFGRLDDFHPHPGEQVLQAYATGGARAVHRLNGVFCAVIGDDQRAEATIVTDIVGQRAPRFLEREGELFLASHELSLHALSGASELDPTSVLSLLACDHSLGGRSLYTGIGNLASGTFLRWREGRATAVELPLLGVEERLDARDTRGIGECTEGVIEALRSSMRHGLESASAPTLSLTAGLDSRTVLALALSVRGGERDLLTVTRGGRRSQDVVWARRVAKLSGVAHRTEPEPRILPDYFLGNARLMALATDGTGNAKRACTEPESPSRLVPLGGEGGETLRGYFYDAWRRYAGKGRPLTVAASPAELAAVLARKMRARLRSVPCSLPCSNPQLEPPMQRLEAALAHLARFPGCASDQLDLYYILERYRHWAAQRWRQTWRNAWCAFSPAAITLAYRLPSPVGTAGIAETIIARHLPRAYWLPVNGCGLLPLHGGARWSRLAQRSLERAYAGWRKLRPLPSESPDARRGALFAGPLYEAIHALLTTPTSAASTVLGAAGVQRLLEEHRRTRRCTEAIGYLVTVDAYAHQVRELQSSAPARA